MKTFIDKRLVLNRFKEAKNIASDKELAEMLGVSKSTLSNWIARDSVDYDLLFSFCEQIDLDWILTGRGSMEIQKNETEPASLSDTTLDYSNCPICVEKDKVIANQSERIDELKETISILKGDCKTKRHSA